MLIDTHCHLTFPQLREQATAVLHRARAAGVTRVITVATTLDDARDALAIVRAHDDVFVAAGIHPHEAGKASDAWLAALRDLHEGRGAELPAGRLVAVGETGLDFHYDFSPRDVQQRIFCAQLELARSVGRPVVIHARQAERRVCEILADFPDLRERFVFHCFSADAATARLVLDAGGWISFTGLVTFRNAHDVQEAARLVPADRIMVETDAPYLSPDPVRKVRPCEPAMVLYTARFLADLRKERFETLAEQTTQNAERFFGLTKGYNDAPDAGDGGRGVYRQSSGPRSAGPR